MKCSIVIFMLLMGCDNVAVRYTPKFKINDCVRIDYKSEFSNTILLFKILTVGHQNYYALKGYSNDGIDFEGRPWNGEIGINEADSIGKLTDCTGRMK